MNSVIVTESFKTIKSLARQSLKGKWVRAFLILLLTSLISSLPSYAVTLLFPESELAAYIANIYLISVSGPLNLSVMSFFLKTARHEETSLNDAVSGFSYFNNAMGLYMNVCIRTFLWSMLLLIPGLVALVRYSQAFFVLADDPTKSPYECISESCRIMDGNKNHYVYMLLSFALWIALAMAPRLWVDFAAVNPSGLQDIFLVVIEAFIFKSATLAGTFCDLLPMIVNIYIYGACAWFYEIASGKLEIVSEEKNGELQI